MKTSGKFKTEERRNEGWDKLCENGVVDIKSYRKFWLKNHPDKNPNIEEDKKTKVLGISSCWDDWSDKSNVATVPCPRPAYAEFMQQKQSEFEHPEDRDFHERSQQWGNPFNDGEEDGDFGENNAEYSRRVEEEYEERRREDLKAAAAFDGAQNTLFFNALRKLRYLSFSRRQEMPGTKPEDLYNMYANWICQLAHLSRRQLDPVLFAAVKKDEYWAMKIVTFDFDPMQTTWFKSVLLKRIMENSAAILTNSKVLPVFVQLYNELNIPFSEYNYQPMNFVEIVKNMMLDYQKKNPNSTNLENWDKMLTVLPEAIKHNSTRSKTERVIIQAFLQRVPWAVEIITTLGLQLPPNAKKIDTIVVSDEEEEEEADSDEKEKKKDKKISKKKCKEFAENLWRINPKTGRDIDPHGATAKKVANECGMLDLINKWKKENKKNPKSKFKYREEEEEDGEGEET